MNVKTIFLPMLALLVAALACNAPLEATTEPIATTDEAAEPITIPNDDEPTAAAAEPTKTPAATDSPPAEDDNGDEVSDPDATPTSDYEAGGLTRTDGPTNDDIYRDFRDDLVNAIVERDYSLMESFIRPTFNAVIYQTEAVSPEFADTAEAIDFIEENVITRTAFTTYSFGSNTTDWIADDPLDYWDTDDPVVAAIPFEGFGEEGETDALVIIAYDTELSEYYWYGVLLVPAGFSN